MHFVMQQKNIVRLDQNKLIALALLLFRILQSRLPKACLCFRYTCYYLIQTLHKKSLAENGSPKDLFWWVDTTHVTIIRIADPDIASQ